jgi:CysZ protein
MSLAYTTAPPGSVSQFFAGAGDVWRGLGLLLGRPSLWIWAAIPFVLNLLLFAAIYWAAGQYAMPWLKEQFFSAEGSFWREALGYLVVALLWITLVLLTLFLFVPIASVVAAPFNDVLSEKVERICAGAGTDLSFSNQTLLKSLWVSFKTTVSLTARTLGLLACVLPLYLIPGIGSTLAAVAQTVITIRYLSLEYTSYSMDRRSYTYRERKAFLERNRPRTLGLGSMAFAIMLIPVANALFIPVSAIAGTLLFCEAERGVVRTPERA